MECLKGCICGKTASLKAIVAAKNEAEMRKFVKALRSEDLKEALLSAAKTGDINCVLPRTGGRPLHEAVKAGNVEMVVQLISAGAKIDTTDNYNETPLDCAKGLGDKQMEKVLLKESSKKKTGEFVDGMDFVSKVPLFSSLHPAEYPKLAAAFIGKTYLPGSMVIQQGEMGNEMFFIRNGTAEVLVKGAGDAQPEKVNVLGAGDYFGEAALLHEMPRNATIIASSELEVKVLSRKDFQELDLRKKLHFVKRKAVRQQDLAGRPTTSAQLVKTPVQREFIKNAIMANPNMGSLLTGLGAKEVDDMVGAAFTYDAAAGAEIITQGDLKADLFFIVEEGTLEVTINGEKVHSYSKGGSFGELALLFRAPRKATVKAIGKPKLWALQRQDLRLLMQARVKKKLQEYAKILGSMTCMQNVPEEDKTNLADALVETTYQEGEYVIKQGEEGRTFFILYQGEVSVLVDNKEVTRYSADPSTGKFESFGERALEMDEPRAASIKAVTPKVTLLALDRGVYNTVRGMSTLRKSGAKNESMVEYKRSELTTLGLLGCGGFGVVTLVKCSITGNTFALKALSKGHIAAQNQERSVMNEKGILRMTHSPFLVRLAATFNGDQHLYFLLEPAMGGELFTIYQRKNFYGSEKHARFYVACVLRGFEHLHARQIIYRDLKPENLLLDSKGYCKVTDFGLAKFVIGHTYTTCGTPDYFAPEMVMGAGHTNAVDWWTLGILAFELLTGESPFSAQDTIHIFRKVQRGIEAVSFPSKTDWAPLVKSLCKQEPSERLPMRKGGGKAVEEHAWFTKAGFDWKALDKRTMLAPYIPQVKSASDMTNFEANEEDAPPDLHYSNTGACWDKDFEDTTGPAKFE